MEVHEEIPIWICIWKGKNAFNYFHKWLF